MLSYAQCTRQILVALIEEPSPVKLKKFFFWTFFLLWYQTADVPHLSIFKNYVMLATFAYPQMILQKNNLAISEGSANVQNRASFLFKEKPEL